MIAREQAVIDETHRLDELHAARGNWTRAQLKSLHDLAGTQTGLKQETDQLIEKLTAAEVFALSLKGAARQIQFLLCRLFRLDGEPLHELGDGIGGNSALTVALKPQGDFPAVAWQFVPMRDE